MHSILIMGSGKIGTTIAQLLSRSDDYRVFVGDVNIPLSAQLPQVEYHNLDATNEQALTEFVKNKPIEAIISCLPYFANLTVAKIARKHELHYFDLTEDVQTAHSIEQLAEGAKTAFISQCGLAPGFVNVIAHHLAQHFERLETVELRTGALPAHTSNALQYALTWSIDGLINQYGNPCTAIESGKPVFQQPLSGLERIQIDGLNYEAFHTSGGLGSLAETYVGKVNTLNYKTIRYPGHCEKMRFLMHDLKLNQNRNVLKQILQNALPTTLQDVVIIYVAIQGYRDTQFIKEGYANKFYPQKIANRSYSAIQMTTACSACAVMDAVLQNPLTYQGYISHHLFDLNTMLTNRFGLYLRTTSSIFCELAALDAVE